MFRKKLILSILAIIITLSFSGCKDKKEIEEQAFVSIIGLDKGKDNNLSITFQIINANFGSSAGKSGGGGGE